ncbi:hypothetical protein L1887_08223 [Cichorium endivia]|nr:hypothetical protein L1887_08223 [Cichorium endivia]
MSSLRGIHVDLANIKGNDGKINGSEEVQSQLSTRPPQYARNRRYTFTLQFIVALSIDLLFLFSEIDQVN